MTLKAITANRLSDGLVVYLARNGGWSDWITDARTAADDSQTAALVATGDRAVTARLVLDPYLIDVAVVDGMVQPLH